MKNKEIPRTITLPNSSYQLVKEYCDEKGLKIGWLCENVLLNYIKKEKLNEKKS